MKKKLIKYFVTLAQISHYSEDMCGKRGNHNHIFVTKIYRMEPRAHVNQGKGKFPFTLKKWCNHSLIFFLYKIVIMEML